MKYHDVETCGGVHWHGEVVFSLCFCYLEQSWLFTHATSMVSEAQRHFQFNIRAVTST